MSPREPADVCDAAFIEAVTTLQELARAGRSGSSATLIHPGLSPDAILAPDAGGDLAIEAKLRTAEARFRALVEQIPVVTFTATLERGVPELYVSPQIEKLLGFTQKEWTEDPILWFRQLHPADRDRLQGEFARTCLTGIDFRSEYRLLARDGRVVWVHGEAQIVRGDDGVPLFLQGVAYDITESKEAEEARRRIHERLEALVEERTRDLTRSNEALQAEVVERRRLEHELRRHAAELKEADRRKDEFLAMLAHELRTPLGPIRNAIEIMRLENGDPSVSQRAQEIVDRQVDNITRLVNDLLEVARITQGRIEIRKERIHLTTLVTRAVETSQPLIVKRRHDILIALPDHPVLLDVDPTRLEQVLSNLLNNAAKYMEPGGRIWLSAACEQEEVSVRVRDEGIGIEPEMLPRVFDLFTQSRQALDRSEGGLGIGLTLVRKLIELHGGKVTAHSEGLGRGSEFVVRLPLAARGDEGGPGDAERSAPAAVRLRVLLVEDNKDAAETLAMLIRLWGHKVQAVQDGPAAIEAARRLRPQVVLLDLGLPGMDGCQVARELKRQDSAKTVLIALTGYGQKEHRERAREAGIEHHITKPVDPLFLQAFLAGVAERR